MKVFLWATIVIVVLGLAGLMLTGADEELLAQEGCPASNPNCRG